MERSTIFKFGKPSISMGHLYHGKLLNNQRVNVAVISEWGIFQQNSWSQILPDNPDITRR
jgi:hypothetical protein